MTWRPGHACIEQEVRTLRHGETVDLTALYETYSDLLFRTALTYVSHSEDAQDVVHDVFAVRRYTPLEDAEHIASPEDSETSELLAAVRSLPDKLHEVVVLHYLEGFSVEETARCLRISVSAVKMRLTRGRQAIKALLGTEE